MEDATVKVLDKTKYRRERGIYRDVTRLSGFGEGEGILPEEQCGFRPQPSAVDTTFVVRRSP